MPLLDKTETEIHQITTSILEWPSHEQIPSLNVRYSISDKLHSDQLHALPLIRRLRLLKCETSISELLPITSISVIAEESSLLDKSSTNVSPLRLVDSRVLASEERENVERERDDGY